MRRLIALLTFVVSVCAIPALAGSAQAAAEDGGSSGITPQEVLAVLTSADPEAGFESMTAEQRAAAATLIAADQESTDVLVASAPLGEREAKALGLKPPRETADPSAAAASGCWYHYYFTLLVPVGGRHRLVVDAAQLVRELGPGRRRTCAW